MLILGICLALVRWIATLTSSTAPDDPSPVPEYPLPITVRPMGVVGRVVAAHCFPPVMTTLVAIPQDLRRHPQVVIGIESELRTFQLAPVIAPVDLHQADIDRLEADLQKTIEGPLYLRS